MTDFDSIEDYIRQSFEENFELLRMQSGVSLAPDVKETALQQVLLYWRKLRQVAENVTETEVRLNLPAQLSPEGREFGIEGIVDIVRDNGRTIMYDIKTHDVDYVRSHPEAYEQQLNVYAYIWQRLRGRELDQTAIIATDYPPALKEALGSQDQGEIERQLECWDPVVDIPFSESRVEETIKSFGEVIDSIENGNYEAPSLDILSEYSSNSKTSFATRVCRNCDARFSCGSYRQYASNGHKKPDSNFFSLYIDETGSETEKEARLSANIRAGITSV